VYLDLENPKLNLTSSTVDTVNKKIKFDYTHSDDKGISSFKLYEKSGSSENFIANLSGDTYTFLGVSKSVYEFIFRLEDLSGNVEEVSKVINVGDIDKPTIKEVFLIKNEDDSFELSLELGDNSGLDRYEIVQKTTVLKEDISGTSYSKKIKIPFTDEKITLNVYDNKENVVSKGLDLDTKISNSYPSKFSDSKYFKLSSNAELCRLSKVDGSTQSDKFDKDDDEFKVRVDANKNEEIEIKFYCERDGFREYFERDFFYDNEQPTESELRIVTTEDGSLKLTWIKAEDEQSEVDYILYKDDKKIYSGSMLEYTDSKVTYPNTYEYYLKVEDEAGNSVKTDKVSEVPKKVKITFELDDNFKYEVKDSDFDFVFETEENVDVLLRVEHNTKEISKKEFKTTSEKINVNLDLNKGKNIIYLDLKDKFGNKNSQEFYVIYEEEILASPVVKKEPVIEPPKEEVKAVVENPNKTEQTENNLVTTKVEVEYQNSNWIWFIIIVLAFVYFIWYFVINEDALKLKDRAQSKKNRTALDKKKKYDLGNFGLKRSKDNVLSKDFDRIKKERILKQDQKKKEEQRNKKLSEKENTRTELEKKKLDDLAKSKKQEVVIPFSQRVKAKRRVNEIKNEISYEEELESSKLNPASVKSKKNIFGKNKKEVKEPSEMDMYLQKKGNSKGWNSTRDYIDKPIVEEKKVEEEIKEKESLVDLQSKKEKEVAEVKNEKKGFFSKFKKSTDNIQNVSESKIEKEDKKEHLDDYLSNIINKKKNKRKSFYFAEKSVDKDLGKLN